MRAFVELRRIASSYALIEKRLEQIERGMGEHDEQLDQNFNALRQLMAPPPQPKRPNWLQGAGGWRVAAANASTRFKYRQVRAIASRSRLSLRRACL